MFFSQDRFNREPGRQIKREELLQKKLALFFYTVRWEYRDLLVLNVLFVAFCIPIVTIPAAMTAMSKVMMRMLMDKTTYVFVDFLAAFKKEWKRATVAGLILFPLLLTTGFGVYYYFVTADFLLMIIPSVFFVMLFMAGFYLFPMIGMIDIGLKSAIKNAFLLVFLRLSQNILAFGLIMIITLFVLTNLPYTIPVLMIGFFALVGLIIVYCAYTGLRKYVNAGEL